MDSYEDFSQIGINLSPPQYATLLTYTIINDTIAQIDFTLDAKEFTLRASKEVKGAELHGVYEAFDQSALGYEVDSDDYSYSAQTNNLSSNSGTIATAGIDILGEDSLYLSLYTDSMLELDDMSSLINDICMSVVDGE